MNPSVETALAFILFLPWFSLLGALYWAFPRRPRHARRRIADALVLLAAAALALAAMRAGFGLGAGRGGHLWAQILATLFAYSAFLAALALAALVRARVLRGRS